MLIREFISEANKSQMIKTLLKYYKVGNVRVKLKSMKNHAHYNVDTGTLELSTRYKTIKSSQVKEFLITILHEINHAMDAKTFGWKLFKEKYEYEMNLQITNGKDPYEDNKFEIQAEEFGQKLWKTWKSKFKKDGLM